MKSRISMKSHGATKIPKHLPIHPVILSSFSIFSIYIYNRADLTISDIERSVAIVILGTLVIWILIYLLTRDIVSSSLWVTLGLVFFYSYGHLLRVTKSWGIDGFIIGRHRFLAPFYLICLIICTWWILRKPRQHLMVSQTLNWMTVIALLSAALPTLGFSGIGESVQEMPAAVEVESYMQQYSECSPGSRPDIYYIILDGYGRADILQDMYRLDNSDFLSFLKGRGFYIAEASHSNYNQTALSLASSLNFKYINYLAGELGDNSLNKSPLTAMIRNSEALKILREYSYQFVTFGTGVDNTEIPNSDYYLSSDVGDESKNVGAELQVNQFEAIYMDTTALKIVLDFQDFLPDGVKRVLFGTTDLHEVVSGRQYQEHRARILFSFKHLADFADREGNYFVFAHIVAPHPPFVFGTHGEPLNPDQPFSLLDGSKATENQAEYIKGYREQLLYVNRLAEVAIAEILAKSQISPIIVIQGDHGPGSNFDWLSIENSNYAERMSILNAYHLPDEPGFLYPSVTPVNSFRLIFNCYFGTDFPLLSDKSYFSLYGKPYDFHDVTDQLH